MSDEVIRFQVRVGPAYGHLLRDLHSVPANNRPERARHLMALGELVERAGGLAGVPVPPADQSQMEQPSRTEGSGTGPDTPDGT